MSDKTKDVVIVGAIRTPIGAYKGSLKNLKADKLGSIVIKEVLKKYKVNNDEIHGKVKILKKTKTLVFLFCELNCNGKIITSASGIWKILKIKTTD